MREAFFLFSFGSFLEGKNVSGTVRFDSIRFDALLFRLSCPLPSNANDNASKSSIKKRDSSYSLYSLSLLMMLQHTHTQLVNHPLFTFGYSASCHIKANRTSIFTLMIIIIIINFSLSTPYTQLTRSFFL